MLLRGFITAASQPKDRGLVFSALALSNILSIIIGSGGFQLLTILCGINGFWGHPKVCKQKRAKMMGAKRHRVKATLRHRINKEQPFDYH